MNKIPIIFNDVKDSLKIKKDEVNITMYTRAVVSGIMYPRSYLEIRYMYIKKLVAYKNIPNIVHGFKLMFILLLTKLRAAPPLAPNFNTISPSDVVIT